MVSVAQVRADTPHHDIVGILKRDGAGAGPNDTNEYEPSLGFADTNQDLLA